jgi:hypothetical protein
MRRLKDFGVAVVTLPSAYTNLRRGCFECRVVAVMGDSVALEPRHPEEVAWLPDHVDDTFVTFRHERSLVGLRGRLTANGAVGDLRFTVTDGVHTGTRSASRIKINAPITLRPAGGSEESHGITVDFSADGILSECDLDVVARDRIGFELSLPGSDEPVSGDATVVRQSSGLIAVQIDRECRAARTVLGAFVLEYNRALLRRPPAPGRRSAAQAGS